MTGLLVLRQNIRNFISKNEVYLKPILKLVISLTALLVINNRLGYMQRINNVAIVLIAALMCSFMPMNFIVLVCAIFIVLHMYALSLEAAAIVLVLFIVLFLLYFRFSPKDTIVVVLTPVCQVLGIPYVIPVTMGLVGTPSSAVSVGCGLAVSFVIQRIEESAAALSSVENDDMAARFRLIIDAILDNKAMLLMIVAFAITIIITYILKRLPINYSWHIAIIAGAITDAVIVLIGALIIDAKISVGGLILGTLLAVLVGFITEFFVFNMDYSGTEKVQFEDDEYYYYVRAVPKVNVAMPSKSVKKINTVKKRPAQQRPQSRPVQRPSGNSEK